MRTKTILAITLCLATTRSMAIPAIVENEAAIFERTGEGDSPQEDEYIEEGEKYYKDRSLPYPLENANVDYDEGRYEKVLNDAQTVLKAVPDNPYATFMLGYALVGLNRHSESVDSFHWLWENDYDYYPDVCRMLIWLASVVPDKMIETFSPYIDDATAASRLKPYLLNDAYTLVAHAESSKGFNRKAIETYQKLYDTVDDEYTRESLLNAMSVCLLKLDQPDEALKLLDRINNENDDYIAEWNNRYLALRDMGRVDEAISLLESMHTSDPDDIAVMVCLATIHTAAGNYDRAISVLDECMSSPYIWMRTTDDFNLVKLRLGIAYQLKGNKATADKYFNEIVSDGVSNAYFHAMVRLGRISEIEKHLEDFIRNNDFSTATSLYACAGMKDQAFQYLKQAFERQQLHPKALPYDVNIRGLLSDSRYAEAVKHFDPSK